MYIPHSFQIDDPAELSTFMRRYSFATLVSQYNGEIESSQIPLLVECDAQQAAVKLVGHLARANKHWERAVNSSVLVLFQGPHAYISPTWYEVKNAVPTWNYVTVQVTGQFRLLNDPQQVLDTLEKTVNFYEHAMPSPWQISHPEPDFIRRLTDSIVAFEIDITNVEGKAKLSQNHDAERRLRVIDALQRSSQPDDLSIADLMRDTLR